MVPIVRTPIDSKGGNKLGIEVLFEGQFDVFRSPVAAKISKRFFKKLLTDGKRNVFLEIFPLSGKQLFETYFVRLIGTPNQHIPKHGHWPMVGVQVVHESLGSELFSESLILAQNERWRRG